MACMLLLAACDNYLDIQPTGSVIPNSLAEYRALLARSYKDVSKFSDRGMACFRSDEMQVRDNEYDQNYYMDIERWNDLAPNAYTSSFEWAKYYNVLFIANHVIESRSDIKEGTEEEINQLVGEAYMLRAYVHFLLVNLYMNVICFCILTYDEDSSLVLKPFLHCPFSLQGTYHPYNDPSVH